MKNIDYRCPECQNGWMRPTGETDVTRTPNKFLHECNQCGYEDYLDRVYPYTIHDKNI